MGEGFLEEAVISAQRAKQVMGDIPITIATHRQIESTIFDSVIVDQDPAYGTEDLLRHIQPLPYDKTLCIDTDIYFYDDVSELFEMLERFDIAAAFTPVKGGTEEYEDVPRSFPEYNCGVLSCKQSPEFNDFVEEWRDIYQSEQEKTSREPAFRKAIYHSDLRLAPLRQEYNCQVRHPGQVVGEVKIFHGRLVEMDLQGRIARRKHYEIEEATEKINRTTIPRTFTQLGGLKIHSNKTNSLIHRTRMAINRGGLRYTINRIIEKIRN